MIIVLRAGASQPEIDHVLDRIKELGLKAHLSQGEHRTIIGVIGDDRAKRPDAYERLVDRLLAPHRRPQVVVLHH